MPGGYVLVSWMVHTWWMSPGLVHESMLGGWLHARCICVCSVDESALVWWSCACLVDWCMLGCICACLVESCTLGG